jgi:hypothetical protein
MNIATRANTNPAGPRAHEGVGHVYCPICTHTVDAKVVFAGKQTRVSPGQKCPRCASSLDAGYIFPMDRAA